MTGDWMEDKFLFIKACVSRNLLARGAERVYGIRDGRFIDIYPYTVSEYSAAGYHTHSTIKLAVRLHGRHTTVEEFIDLFKATQPELVRLVIFHMDEFE